MYRYILMSIFFVISSLCEGAKYDSFPNDTCYLHELKSEAARLEKNNFKNAESILRTIKSRVLKDPKIITLKMKSALKYRKVASRYHAPFDNFRAGRQIKGLYINATEARTKRQNFILAECPKTKALARDYFEAALAKKTKVFVSVLQATEAKNHCNNFWKEKVLKKIPLRDGSKIKYIKSAVLQKQKSSHKKRVPQIIESTLLSNEHQCTHLHYDGWKDKSAAPCKKLLGLLLDRITELSPDPTVSVGINCRGGVGRTGLVAISLYLRREVDAQLKAGVPLSKITVNIPEAIYSFRKIHKSIISTPAQLAQLYSTLHDYYLKLKHII